MAALTSQTISIQIDKSSNSRILTFHTFHLREEETKSPNSTIVPDQQREEEAKIPNSNSVGDLDYGLLLPREIWLSIGKLLESRLDISRFRSVCRTWRSILPPPFRFPIRVPPVKIDEKASGHFITEVTYYAIKNMNMIVLFEEEYRGGEFSASALVHMSQIPLFWKFVELPPVAQIPNLSFLCKAYHLHHAYPRSIQGKTVANKCDFRPSKEVLKIAIICSDDGLANINPNYPRLRDLKVVAHLAADRKLAVLSLGGGAMTSNWKTGFCSIAFDDIVKYRGRLYGVESSGRAFVMDYESLHMTQVAPALSNYEFAALPYWQSAKWKLMHLAVVSGDLYMFVHEYKDLDIVVPPGIPKLYKLSLGLGKWLEAEQDLPGQVFIADMLCNFAVSRDLLVGHDENESRSCMWPCYQFVRVAVGFKPNWHVWNRRDRVCDDPCLPYYYP